MNDHSSKGGHVEKMQSDVLQRTIEEIENENFLASTSIASGYATVAELLSATPEVQTLLANARTSLSLMRARYREHEARMTDAARLVYFVVFGLTRDREMLEDIVAYLKQHGRLSTSTLIWPWHPYMHGVKALELITSGHVQTPGTGGSVKQFDEFLSEVERWAMTHQRSADKR